MATFYEFFNEQKYADAVKNVSIDVGSHGLAAPCHMLLQRDTESKFT